MAAWLMTRSRRSEPAMKALARAALTLGIAWPGGFPYVQTSINGRNLITLA
jgi:hypothetical protein